jgi:hypothetical protein
MSSSWSLDTPLFSQYEYENLASFKNSGGLEVLQIKTAKEMFILSKTIRKGDSNLQTCKQHIVTLEAPGDAPYYLEGD